MNIDKSLTVGQRFKKIRKDKGISQKELCEGICSDSVVSHIETDRQYPSAHIWGKLAERLRVPVYEILGEQERVMDTSFLLDMVRVYLEKGDFHHALELVELVETHDLLEHQRLQLLISRGECLLMGLQYDEVIMLLLPFIEKQQIAQTVDDETLCRAFRSIGSAYFHSQDFEKAFSMYEQGYRISLRLPKDTALVAKISYNLGLTCNQLGLKEDARRYLEKAQTYYDSVADIQKLADTFFALAISTHEKRHILSARTLYESLNLVHEANVVKQFYAFNIISKSDIDLAIHEMNTVTHAFNSMGDIGMCVYTCSRSAILCMENERIGDAKQYLDKASLYLEKSSEPNNYLSADYYKAYAMYHLKQKNYDQCIEDSKRASAMCDKMGLYTESATSLRLAAEAYHQMGKNEDAYRVSQNIIDLLCMKG